ncbi:MAG: ribonuclease Z [Bacteroidetes bacterium]|nr:ribonuclease Z [Bacteroidota bacterium]
MFKFNITVLGSSSAIPTTERNPTAQLINHNDHLFLIDCGEGTQVTLRKMHIHFQKINHIFISHLHGDHFFGLIGLISSMHLLGRTKKLTVYGPPDLKEILDLQLRVTWTELQYPLVFHPTQADKPEQIFDNESLSVFSFPVLHRIPTTGFIFKEKQGERRIRKEAISLFNIPLHEIASIKKGSDFRDSKGILHSNASLTIDPYPVRSYAYCADTAYFEEIIPVIKGVDLLYHETTFMQDKAANAAEKFHSTTKEAATIALKAGAKRLIIGHYSARYDDLQPLLLESREVFPQTELAYEGLKVSIGC